MDQRPIITFPSKSVQPQMLNLHERLKYIRLWARAIGQINRDPAVWAPEWVVCSYILYSKQIEDGVQFSIIWEDDSEVFRHAIDFKPLPQPFHANQ